MQCQYNILYEPVQKNSPYGSRRTKRTAPCLEVSTMFLLKRLYLNIQMCAYLSHFFYAKNYFNFFVFMI